MRKIVQENNLAPETHEPANLNKTQGRVQGWLSLAMFSGYQRSILPAREKANIHNNNFVA
jgi:hypothetical protein